jgi:hypothetical protein
MSPPSLICAWELAPILRMALLQPNRLPQHVSAIPGALIFSHVQATNAIGLEAGFR